MTTLDMQRVTEQDARKFFEELRWPNGPVCPHCQSKKVAKLGGAAAERGVIHCTDCRKQFTVKAGTVFESSHIPLSIWLKAMHYICASKKGVSSLQLSRMLGVTYKSAWFMSHRIRFALKVKPPRRSLRGDVEVDETYVGPRLKGHGHKAAWAAKTPVLALIQRGGNAITFPVKRVSGKTAKATILKYVHPDSTIMTDDSRLYRTSYESKKYDGEVSLNDRFLGGHHAVNHAAKEYVRGEVSTNTAESYFALLKRGLHGSFHHVSAKHLHRYCDEFSFRWNHRKITDAERTSIAAGMIAGKRLKYA